MIKAIILDVDGVIVGEEAGFNFPLPHAEVMERLRSIREKGIPISLCTSRPHWSVEKIITGAELDNLHISLAGGVIIDPIDNVVLEKHPIEPIKAREVTQMYLENGAYTELYTLDNYILQADQVRDFLTTQHAKILQKQPLIVDSLLDEIDKHEIFKVMPVGTDESDRIRLNALFEPFAEDLVISWAIHPSANPHKFANITARGISKRQATTTLAQNLGIQPSEILGVGDGISDWQFMELCGYAAAMGNASNNLKELVTSRDEKSFIGQSVDQNGILGIFDHFGL